MEDERPKKEVPKIGLYSEQHAIHLAMLRYKDDEMSPLKSNFNAKITINNGKVEAEATGDKETIDAPKHCTAIYKCARTGLEREVTAAINPERYATEKERDRAVDKYFKMWKDARVVSDQCTFVRIGRNYLEVMHEHGLDAEDINSALLSNKRKARAILERSVPSDKVLERVAKKTTKKELFEP